MHDHKRNLLIYSIFAAFGASVLFAWILNTITQRQYYALTLSAAFLFCVHQFWYVLPGEDESSSGDDTQSDAPKP